jgi:hypothetical protein
MAGAEEVADRLLSADAGMIAGVNILDGIEAELYDSAFAASVLWWWGEYALQTNKTGVEIAHALGTLPDLADGKIPPGFIKPAIPLENVHIKCRRADTVMVSERRASVRDAAAMQYWADSDALQRLSDAGIDIFARGGTPTYSSTMAKLRPDYVRDIGIDVGSGSTLTNARRGANAIMFFTIANDILPVIQSQNETDRADAARDALGLVHVEPAFQHIAVVFESNPTEYRGDRGRPTVIDSGGNTRFLSLPHGLGPLEPWGRTADLALVPGNWPDVCRMRERVCGQFPTYNAGASSVTTVEVHFLGVALVPRSDVIGTGDDKYARLLEERWEKARGTTVRNGLVELLEQHMP